MLNIRELLILIEERTLLTLKHAHTQTHMCIQHVCLLPLAYQFDTKTHFRSDATVWHGCGCSTHKHGTSVLVAHAGSLGVWHISKGVPGYQSFLAT